MEEQICSNNMAQIRDKEEHMWKKEEEVIINGSNTEEIHAKYHVV